MFSGWEIVLVVAVLFLLFGASRLPQLAKSLGQSRRAFKEGLAEVENELTDDSEPKAIDTAEKEDDGISLRKRIEPFTDLFSTHPGTDDRIARLKPRAGGTEPAILSATEWSALKAICK